jgi:arylsulfatase
MKHPHPRVHPRQPGFDAVAALALLALAVDLPAIAASPEGAMLPKKPNFLICVADDMGYSDAGCYGGEIQTPNLDRLAAGGLRFTQMYSTARCWPSRACILTGYYAQQVRMDPPQGRLPDWCRVMPHYLKPLGYRCYHSGKWHLMGAPRPVADGGFDRSYCLEDHNRFFAPKNALLDDQRLPPVPDGSDFYVATAIANYGIEFLKEHAANHAGKPFVLYLAFTSPHFPLQAPQEDIDRYRDRFLEGWDAVRAKRFERLRQMGLVRCEMPPREPQTIPFWNFAEADLVKQIGPGEVGRAVAWNELTNAQKRFQATKMAIHAAMIDRMDRELGRVLDQIRAMRAFEHTVVFFVSDNGASAEQIIRGDGHDPTAPAGSAKSYLCLGPGWSTAANTPFRLHKHWVHEGGIASPLIVHWPAGLRARGELRHTPGHFIDLVPTMLELAGADAVGSSWKGATPPPLPGRSLVPAFAAEVPIPREYLYWHHMTNRAIRVGDWKLVSAGDKNTDGPWELYDLRVDRGETKNFAATHPDRVRQLEALWRRCDDQFRQQAGAPEPKKSPAKPKPKRKPVTGAPPERTAQ